MRKYILVTAMLAVALPGVAAAQSQSDTRKASLYSSTTKILFVPTDCSPAARTSMVAAEVAICDIHDIEQTEQERKCLRPNAQTVADCITHNERKIALLSIVVNKSNNEYERKLALKWRAGYEKVNRGWRAFHDAESLGERHQGRTRNNDAGRQRNCWPVNDQCQQCGNNPGVGNNCTRAVIT